jgi:hypothetical protein
MINNENAEGIMTTNTPAITSDVNTIIVVVLLL